MANLLLSALEELVRDFPELTAEIAPYFSNAGLLEYMKLVEIAFATALTKYGIYPKTVSAEIVRACGETNIPVEALEEAESAPLILELLFAAILRQVSPETKPFINCHFAMSVEDVLATTDALCARDFMKKVLLPKLVELEMLLIELSEREAGTRQLIIGADRTALPGTFGFSMANYVSRLGQNIERLNKLTAELVGKFSGIIGAHNSLALFVEEPEEFEKAVLRKLGLKRAELATGTIPTEILGRVTIEALVTMEILSDLAHELHSLQFLDFSPERLELLLDFDEPIFDECTIKVYALAKRLTDALMKLSVNHLRFREELLAQDNAIAAEALCACLTARKHPQPIATTEKLLRQAIQNKKSLHEVAMNSQLIRKYWEKFTPKQTRMILNPDFFIGSAERQARAVAKRWRERLGKLRL